MIDLRESKEYATHFCLNCQEKMCKNCVKYHKRGQLTRNHELISLSETTSLNFIPNKNKDKEDVCRQHQERPIELLCQVHKQSCCSICAGIKHKNVNIWKQ